MPGSRFGELERALIEQSAAAALQGGRIRSEPAVNVDTDSNRGSPLHFPVFRERGVVIVRIRETGAGAPLHLRHHMRRHWRRRRRRVLIEDRRDDATKNKVPERREK